MDEGGRKDEPDARPELKIRRALWWLLVPLAFLNLFLILHAMAVGQPEWEWAVYALAGASGATLFAGWLIAIRGLRVPAVPKLKQSEVPDGCRRVAVLVVHGMGVQDRYQTLSDFAGAIPTHTRQREGEVVPLEGDPGDDHVPIWDGDRCRIDFHEAYWGHLFNRLTTPMSACVFMVRALLKFFPTLFTRFWWKRLFETVFALVALAVVYFLFVWSYGGFVIAARTLEHLQAHVRLTRQINAALDDAYSPCLMGERIWTRSSAPKQEPPRLHEGSPWMPPDNVAIVHVLRQVEDDDPTNQDVREAVWLDVHGQEVNTAPTWSDLNREYRRFAWAAAERIREPPWEHSIPFDEPWKYIAPRPKVFIAVSVVYGIAYGLLLISIFRLVAALWHYALTFKAKNLRPEKILLTNLRTAIGGTILPTTICLALYPILDPLLIEFFTAVAVLVLTYKGLCWWVVNYFGDVQIYATLNANVSTCEAREKATNLVAERIVDLLKIDDRGLTVDDGALPQTPLYDRIVLVAHSLGSVIALHAMRRLRLRGAPYWAELRQRCVFVTIGSPLRKFRQLFQAMPYRWYFGDDDVSLDREIFIGDKTHAPDHIPWFNYWYTNDIFADRLAYLPRGDFSRRIVNDGDAATMIVEARKEGSADLDRSGFPVGVKRDRNLGVKFRLWPHSDYWIDHRFVDDLLDFATQEMSVVKMMQVPTPRT